MHDDDGGRVDHRPVLVTRRIPLHRHAVIDFNAARFGRREPDETFHRRIGARFDRHFKRSGLPDQTVETYLGFDVFFRLWSECVVRRERLPDG